MKRMMKLWTVVAVAAMGLVACQSNFDEPTVNPDIKNSITVSFVAEEARTSVDTSGEVPLFSWNDDETFAVLEQTDALAEATSVTYNKVDGKANIDAEFVTNAGKGEYKYVAVYPKSGYVAADNLGAVTLILSADQTMYSEESYDPNADLMVSWPVTTTVQPTEAQPMRFTRLVAVAKMPLNNLALGADEAVEKVVFTAEGKTLAGKITADLVGDPHAFSVSEGVSTVEVTTTASDEVYFTVLPTTLEAGDAYSVVVLTNKALYVKQGVIPADKSLVFEAGMVTRIGVNMSGVAPSEKWVLVRDASTLEAGDVVTIVAQNNNYVLGCNSTTNYPCASTNTAIIKIGDYLYHPIVTDKSKYQYMVQPLVLSKQDATKAAFDFYNGVDYEGDSKSGYLTNAQTNNYLQLSAYPSKNSAFEISVEDGVATIEAKDSEFDNTLLKFFNYNPNSTTSTYRRFVCIDAASVDATKHDDVCIYKAVGKKADVPVAGAVITVPDADEPVVVGVEGVAEATAFADVKFTYVGDWTVTATTNAEWLTLNYADGVLKYTATANEGITRNATVTITATHEGEEDIVKTFSVVQKGAPIKVTVAEFITKKKDPNVEYEVTGVLSSKASSNSGTTKIKDANGNEASFKYVYMANDVSFANNADIKVGDVVTIVAAVCDTDSSGKAVGGSSDTHALCKGYYNLSATADSDLVGYAGGSVKIAINKVGTLAPVGDINGSAEGAELTYETNAEEATLVLGANDGAPRLVVVTFTDGYASASVAVVQGADTAKGNTWELVTDASTLALNDQVIVAAATYDVAMSTTIDSNNRRSAVAVTKLGNYYLTPNADVQTLVLGKGSVEGTFVFYDGVNEGFLVSSSTSTYNLKNQSYIDANTSFAISIADGVATIGNKEGTYSECKFGYRAGSYNYFFSGTSTTQEKVCLYRLVGVKGEIPVVPADVTVPTKSVVVPEEGATVATPIDDVKFNYVGEWNISAEAAENWISFAFDKANNCLTYTAAKNEGTVRETAVTITASMDGQESKSWEFNLLQKGKPMEISCDALNDKEKNLDISYKLTGRVVSVPTSYSGNYVLDDGSGRTANVCYIYTDNDQQVYGNANIGLAVGDVVTVTTIVYTAGKGGNTNYHSIYKGHYRLTATADTTLLGYEGGTATITVAAESSSPEFLPAGGVIKGAMAEAYDFVTFNYTDNTATATAQFAANSGASRSVEFNFTYGLASASVTIGQYNHPDVKVGWFLVTDVNELAVGDKVVIAGKSPDGTKDYAIKKYISNTGTSSGIAISLLGNSINGVDGVEQFTLGNGHADYNGTWSFVCDSYSRYLQTNSNNTKITSTLDKTGSWTIEIAADGKATLTSKTGTSTSSKNIMMFNYTTSTQTFGAYTAATTGKGAIYIYKYYNSLAQ